MKSNKRKKKTPYDETDEFFERIAQIENEFLFSPPKQYIKSKSIIRVIKKR